MKNYVIIGVGNAGLTCAKTIRKINNEDKITLITHENYPPYCRCLLTYFIEGKVSEDILFNESKKIIKNLNLNFIQNEKVEEIDVNGSYIKLSSGLKIFYDKLFISSGAKPKGAIFENDYSILVTNLRELEDAKKIKNNFKKGDVAVVEGGGLVSLKTLLALYRLGIKIYWVVKSEHILSFLVDKETALIIEDFVKEKGIEIIKGAKIIGVKNKFVKLDNGMEIKSNGVIIGKGVVANEIYSNAKLEFDDGYIVDEFFQTNIENIFAGGDCAKIFDKAHNKRWKVALWPIAGIAGLYAGKNMANIKSKFYGAVPVNSFSVFDNDVVVGGKKKIEKSEENEFFEFSERNEKIFKKFIIDKDENLRGFVLINNIFNAGRYYWEIAGGLS